MQDFGSMTSVNFPHNLNSSLDHCASYQSYQKQKKRITLLEWLCPSWVRSRAESRRPVRIVSIQHWKDLQVLE